MQKIKVLIADDSVVYRSQIREALQSIAGVEVVGVAAHGRLALEKLAQTAADLLILDLEMPEMNGLQTLAELNRCNLKCKVLVFSSASKREAEITLEALRLGASDFITKPSAADIGSTLPSDKIKALLEPKIQGLFFSEMHPSTQPSVPTNYPKLIWELVNPKIVVIGCSTGGPTVLESLFSRLASPLNCPILIVQHMPPIFTATLAEQLGRLSGIPSSEVKNGMALEINHIYIAPGDYHMRLQGSRERATFALDQSPQIHSVRPAVDPMFSSVASIFKEKCLGIVLTGMGSDGAAGAESVKQHGGAVVIQDKKSSVVWGMPGAVFACGAFDLIKDPDGIIDILHEKVALNKRGAAASAQRN